MIDNLTDMSHIVIFFIYRVVRKRVVSFSGRLSVLTVGRSIIVGKLSAPSYTGGLSTCRMAASVNVFRQINIILCFQPSEQQNLPC